MAVFYDVGETVLSADPFAAEVTYAIDGASLTVTIDEELSVGEPE